MTGDTEVHVLYIEDNQKLYKPVSRIFKKRGVMLDCVGTGEEGLDILRTAPAAYDVIILDLKLDSVITNAMNGEQVLAQIKEEGLKVPPIIVISGHLGRGKPGFAENKLHFLGAAHVIGKPFRYDNLAEVAKIYAKGGKVADGFFEFDEELLHFMVQRREGALLRQLHRDMADDHMDHQFEEPILVIGRRWNSWYPSLFPVPGGSYAIIAPKPANGSSDSSATPKGVIIDPGFRFLEILRKLKISLAHMDSFIITHNHPDHLGGVFELISARHVLGKQTRAYCNSTVSNMLGDCSGFKLEIKTLGAHQHDLISPYQHSASDSGNDNQWLSIKVKGFDTAHEEIGKTSTSQGLCIGVERGPTEHTMDASAELVILGDTEYNKPNCQHFLDHICKANVKAVVLHIGSSQLKQKTGKHLYFTGLKEILLDLERKRKQYGLQDKLNVLISEWGLEHATGAQLKKICGEKIGGFTDHSPILETIKILQKGLTKLQLIPADIGLMIGLESGNAYLQDGTSVEVKKLAFGLDDEGVTYYKKELTAKEA